MIKKKKWKSGNGEMIGFAIVSIAICSVILIMVSFLQLSVGLNTITKAANAVSRSTAICTSLEDAEKQAQMVAESAITYTGVEDIRTSISYATDNKEWQSGNLIRVTVDMQVNTITPITSSRQSKSVLICIENASGNKISIPETYNGLTVSGRMTITEYDRFNWAHGTRQRTVYDRWVAQGKQYSDGIAVLDGCYLIACTELFGMVGDRVYFTLENGEVLNCIIADMKSKNDSNYTQYGHTSGAYITCLEMEVDSAYYQNYGNPATSQWKPEWNSRPITAVNMGSTI